MALARFFTVDNVLKAGLEQSSSRRAFLLLVAGSPHLVGFFCGGTQFEIILGIYRMGILLGFGVHDTRMNTSGPV